jgi:hypothetical protein
MPNRISVAPGDTARVKEEEVKVSRLGPEDIKTAKALVADIPVEERPDFVRNVRNQGWTVSAGLEDQLLSVGLDPFGDPVQPGLPQAPASEMAFEAAPTSRAGDFAKGVYRGAGSGLTLGAWQPDTGRQFAGDEIEVPYIGPINPGEAVGELIGGAINVPGRVLRIAGAVMSLGGKTVSWLARHPKTALLVGELVESGMEVAGAALAKIHSGDTESLTMAEAATILTFGTAGRAATTFTPKGVKDAFRPSNIREKFGGGFTKEMKAGPREPGLGQNIQDFSDDLSMELRNLEKNPRLQERLRDLESADHRHFHREIEKANDEFYKSINRKRELPPERQLTGIPADELTGAPTSPTPEPSGVIKSSAIERTRKGYVDAEGKVGSTPGDIRIRSQAKDVPSRNTVEFVDSDGNVVGEWNVSDFKDPIKTGDSFDFEGKEVTSRVGGDKLGTGSVTVEPSPEQLARQSTSALIQKFSPAPPPKPTMKPHSRKSSVEEPSVGASPGVAEKMKTKKPTTVKKTKVKKAKTKKTKDPDSEITEAGVSGWGSKGRMSRFVGEQESAAKKLEKVAEKVTLKKTKTKKAKTKKAKPEEPSAGASTGVAKKVKTKKPTTVKKTKTKKAKTVEKTKQSVISTEWENAPSSMRAQRDRVSKVLGREVKPADVEHELKKAFWDLDTGRQFAGDEIDVGRGKELLNVIKAWEKAATKKTKTLKPKTEDSDMALGDIDKYLRR